jgi:uncharacterized sporulation protein YeaH/YhbH (DUF444 family)
MPVFIDRRLNPKGKSLSNRQRFLKRCRAQVKEAVDQVIRERGVADADRGETITIPAKRIHEPKFKHADTGGIRENVYTGNSDFIVGDRIDKQIAGGGKGGKEGSNHGQTEDSFRFHISREEFLDLFFEGLELPDLLKKNLKKVYSEKLRRSGYSVAGTPANINLLRTMRNSMGRRLALKRPKQEEVQEILRKIFELEKVSNPTKAQLSRLKKLHAKVEEMGRKRKVIAYVDPLDVRYNYFVPKPEPSINAVMFCLMDTSASMGQREKDLAKRFFVLLHLFLMRQYQKIDVVFIRHTHESREVDEETFFYSTDSGGTIVSTALQKMEEVILDRYPVSEWNIYAAQASDGENFPGDAMNCEELLSQVLMPLCQYYAYIEILDEREAEIWKDHESGTELWRIYRQVYRQWPNFEMKRIFKPGDIYPVFRELFAKKTEAA